MCDVLIALTPAAVCSVLFFGWMSLAVIAVCMAACFVSELLYGMVRHRKFSMDGLKESTAWDCSCLVTGLLLALNLSVTIPLWAAAVASVFAVVIVKMLFGGIGKNIFNPALMGRIFLFIALGRLFATEAANNIIGLAEDVSGATWLLNRPYDPTGFSLLNMFIGNTGAAAIGETSVIAILLGFAYLSVRKVIDFRLPLLIIAGTAAFAFLFDCLVAQRAVGEWGYTVAAHIMSGGLMLGAVFMATDYSTSPNTMIGTIIYGLGIAFLVVLIRVFSESLPEGVSFAIVIMNAVSVILDRFIRPRFFGKGKVKKAKALKEARV